MDIATKTGIGTTKTASKRVAQKTAEAAGDLIGKKQQIKLLQQVKQKVKKKKKKQIKDKKFTYRQKKDSKLKITFDCFRDT